MRNGCVWRYVAPIISMAKCRRRAPRYAGRASAVSDGEVVKCKKKCAGQKASGAFVFQHLPVATDRRSTIA
jgi:hypothetical protein